ncbi:Proto-oncoprotein Wnt-3 [Branchiostoma belcheri]|nr:Proto-oncoprotein Wnt-3 [Branchiostoma belcheri]
MSSRGSFSTVAGCEIASEIRKEPAVLRTKCRQGKTQGRDITRRAPRAEANCLKQERYLAVGPQFSSLAASNAGGQGRRWPLVCSSIPGLVPRQIRYCRKFHEIMPFVADGTKLGIRECQHQFRGRRWNCTTVQGQVSIFGPVLDRGNTSSTPKTPPRAGDSILGPAVNRASREAAFVHAITSAGVAYSVTKACAEGTSPDCGCDNRHKGPPGEGWKWGGCSEDVLFGTKFSRDFVDARIRGRRDGRSAMDRHNNEAGRQGMILAVYSNLRGPSDVLTRIVAKPAGEAQGSVRITILLSKPGESPGQTARLQSIMKNLQLKCKCHGLSGSCEIKTCWWAQPDFRTVGNVLKDKYDSASEMAVERHREPSGMVDSLYPRYSFFKAPGKDDLIYFENSPNFCEPNNSTGSLGTKGRECNITSHGIDGCQLMCCGRGWNTRTELRTEKCHCQFHWCCYVTCQECQKKHQVHTCK